MIVEAALLAFQLAAAPVTGWARVTPEPPPCPPRGYDRPALERLKAVGWAVADHDDRDALALGLAACLASPDPTMRDGIAYEAFFTWLRGGELSAETMLALQADLQARLAASEGEGFERPFAALALAEVARADRIEAYLPEDTRADLVRAAAAYLESVRDYRGFDEAEGWRHGVAHGADLVLQLALNPVLDKGDLSMLRDAIASQVAPAGHSYVYGESERLAAPIVYMARRGVFSAQEWTEWLLAIATPPPSLPPQDVFTTQTGLAWRHDTAGFLSALTVNARYGDDASDDALIPGLEAAVAEMP